MVFGFFLMFFHLLQVKKPICIEDALLQRVSSRSEEKAIEVLTNFRKRYQHSTDG